MRLSDYSSYSSLVLRLVGVVTVIALARALIRLYQVRTMVRNVSKKHGIPILPHSFLFGHILVIGKLMTQYPYDIFGHWLPTLLSKAYPDLCASRGVVYVDIWPIWPPMLSVFHPDILSQFTQEQSRPKHQHVKNLFQPFTGCLDMLTSEGQVWKTWRSMFNSGFSSKNLIHLAPAMIEEIEVWCDWLRKVALSGQPASLEYQAERLTVDVISRTVLDCRLHSQTTENTFFAALRRQIAWLIANNRPELVLLKNWNPIRPFAMWNNDRIMKNYLLLHIQKMITQQSEKDQVNKPKTVLGLALGSSLAKEYGVPADGKLGGVLWDMIFAQLKTFMFAGHDTTASVLCYSYHLLSVNPEILTTMRREHDEVLGPDAAAAATVIRATPTLLNQLPYTSALLKETMRMFPPLSTIRTGGPDFFLTHPETGEKYPTDGIMLFGCSAGVHRNEIFWPRPHECLPERWFAPEGHPLHVRKNAYRPFELGPRNCIGQEMAQLELRAILAMTVRQFDIKTQFPDDGKQLFGDPGYQTQMGKITPHPRNGMPVTVKIREGKSTEI